MIRINTLAAKCTADTGCNIRRIYPAVSGTFFFFNRVIRASIVPTDRECIFLPSRHFGIRRHVFARRDCADAGEPFPTRDSENNHRRDRATRVVLFFRMFRLRRPLVMTSLTQFRARQRHFRVFMNPVKPATTRCLYRVSNIFPPLLYIHVMNLRGNNERRISRTLFTTDASTFSNYS